MSREIVCEDCNSWDFEREDGLYVCQNCGRTYTGKEVRNRLFEVNEPKYLKRINRKYKNPGDDPVSRLVSEVLNRLAEMTDYKEALEYLIGLEDQYEFAEFIGPSLRIGDFWIQYSKTFFQETNFYGLEKGKTLSLTCVPEPVAYLEYPKYKDCFIAFRLPGTDTSQIVSYKEGAHLVTREAKQQLLEDVAKMAEENWLYSKLHPSRSDEWFVVPSTGRIVIREYGTAFYKDQASVAAVRKILMEYLGVLE